MYVGARISKKVIEDLHHDRHVGATVTELMAIYTLPKTTIWHHIKNEVLDPEIQLKIKKRKGGSTLRKAKKVLQAEALANTLLVSTSCELIISAAMLYWAEGHKKEFTFTNTDPKMLKLIKVRYTIRQRHSMAYAG